jgi:uncharacterized membrane protein
MKRLLLPALFLFLFCLGGSASAYEISGYCITFDIMPDASVRENVSMVFSEPLNSSTLSYIVLGEVSDITVSDGLNAIDYTLEKTGSEYRVRFTVPEGTRRLEILFTAKDLVFARDNVYSFSTELNPPPAKKLEVFSFLPEGFSVYRNVIYPEGYETLSDGRRIFLKWSLGNPDSVMLSFKFYSAHTDYSVLVLIVMGVALVAAVAYLSVHFSKKVKREFERGFSEDERKVLLILSREKTVMQKKVEKELGFSRAKMTRMMKRLEEKGLIEKERVGRTNRIFYKK